MARKKRHFGMTMPVAFYPTKDSLPVHRELIPIWTDEELKNHTQTNLKR